MLAIVVDDSRVIRMILRKALVSLGFQVIEAADGQEGLDVLTANGGAEVLLVDWNMPVMDGLALVRAVRGDRNLDGTRIVMVTSEAEISRITQAIEAGADEYLMKPFEEAALRDKLELLGIHQPASA